MQTLAGNVLHVVTLAYVTLRSPIPYSTDEQVDRGMGEIQHQFLCGVQVVRHLEGEIEPHSSLGERGFIHASP